VQLAARLAPGVMNTANAIETIETMQRKRISALILSAPENLPGKYLFLRLNQRPSVSVHRPLLV
jgi:hypothetical protein